MIPISGHTSNIVSQPRWFRLNSLGRWLETRRLRQSFSLRNPPQTPVLFPNLLDRIKIPILSMSLSHDGR
jgi:hypothetical protein